METKLQHGRSELAALENKKQTLKKAIDRETERLKAESETEITALTNQLAAHNDQLDKQIAEKELSIDRLTNQLEALTLEVDRKESLIAPLEKKTITLTQLIEDKTAELEPIKQQKTDLLAEIAELKNQLSTVLTELSDARTVLSGLNDEKDDVKSDIDLLKEQHDIIIEEHTKKLQVIKDKIDNYQLELAEEQKIQEETRRAIASQQLALDEREKNLRVREARVEQESEAIARNSNLLNL